MTLRSCTDYGGEHNNDACFLVIQKQMRVSTKIIKPGANSKMHWVPVSTLKLAESVPTCVNRTLTPPRKPQRGK